MLYGSRYGINLLSYWRTLLASLQRPHSALLVGYFSKVELSHPNAELRLLEVFYHKIYKIFPLTERIENINDQYWTSRAEEIPEEEKDLGPTDRLIHVYHFTKETTHNQMQVQNFGVKVATHKLEYKQMLKHVEGYK
ncbi:unnamed protein product [Lactuca virosa]|uniref:ubiquitinyl hydrolase 1 n=1 Tax=Lactuca virosa TaxID=75947 RepID=A0AAU9M0E2_9ASTR|nr:unnamed protein product [Lactuca virosa]